MRVTFTVEFAEADNMSTEAAQQWIEDVQDAINDVAYVSNRQIITEPTLPAPDACKADECRGHLTADRTVTYC